MTQFYRMILPVLCLLIFVATGAQAAETKEVNLYSAQQYPLIEPLLKAFTEDTGIKVNTTTMERDMMNMRLISEGKDTPADVVLTVNVGNLYQLQKADMLRQVKSETLEQNVPEALRSKDGYWYAIGTRSRVVYKRVGDDIDIKHYDDLADPKYKGQILVRSSENEYNISLLASIIAHEGKEKALAWAKGVVANFARQPAGGDRDQLRALAAGEGRLAIANTYYWGVLANSEDPADREAAAKITRMFPEQDGRGAHVNIRGGAITKYSKHPELAQQLLEYLTGDKAQAILAEKNHEFPANPKVPVSATVKSWGNPKFDVINLETIGSLNSEATKIFDEARWP